MLSPEEFLIYATICIGPLKASREPLTVYEPVET